MTSIGKVPQSPPVKEKVGRTSGLPTMLLRAVDKENLRDSNELVRLPGECIIPPKHTLVGLFSVNLLSE